LASNYNKIIYKNKIDFNIAVLLYENNHNYGDKKKAKEE
jgi:hypothetical protein